MPLLSAQLPDLPNLPIQANLPQLRLALAQHTKVILSAPPGSGKTTLVPLALLDEPWLAGRSILMLEPRRLAARMAAGRMAELLHEPLGERVGYRIRQESRVSARTRIQVLTEGILSRRLQSDPELDGVGLVIFDEFHERSLQADLALALCLDVADALRPDLRILIMSATLELKALGQLLPGAPTICGQGQSHPLQIQYLRHRTSAPLMTLAQQGVLRAFKEQTGDILIFLPGSGEIRRLAAILESDLGDALPADVQLRPLYADLSRSDQTLAILPDPQGRRRIVLATSVAETSLTIEGIHTVVDLGLSRLPSFDPNTGLGRLLTKACSQAAADQRAGRAGRLGPGHVYRLWTEQEQNDRPKASPPEILNADLASLALEVARWGLGDAADLQWLDPPPPAALAQARELLRRLGLVDDRGRITPRGQRASDLGLHPRLAQLLLSGESLGVLALAADLAALLSEGGILNRAERSANLWQSLQLLAEWRTGQTRQTRQTRWAGLDVNACRRLERTARQLISRCFDGHGHRPEAAYSQSMAAQLLLAAWPERLAQRTGPLRYRLAAGGAASLPEGDALCGSDWLVVAELDAGQREGRIFSALPLELAQIEACLVEHLGERLEWRPELSWQHGRVCARELLVWGRLSLRERPLDKPDPEAVSACLLEAMARKGLEALPWTQGARDLQARVLSLRHWQPDAGWPDLGDAALLARLKDWLAPWVPGFYKEEHLARLDMAAILRGLLSWEQQQALDQLAPARIRVPSGSDKRLDYRPGEAPLLAVRLQEVFGLEDGPRVCRGEVPVLLDLLSPAQRPVQRTQDLSGFWQRGYAEVKKELKGRYPKHYWPDNPLTAEPTARARPRNRA